MSTMRDLFGGGMPQSGPFGNISRLIGLLTSFMKNPFGALVSLGLNIPQNIGGNPEAMVNYLRNSGRMDDQTFNQCKELSEQVQHILPRQF